MIVQLWYAASTSRLWQINASWQVWWWLRRESRPLNRLAHFCTLHHLGLWLVSQSTANLCSRLTSRLNLAQSCFWSA